MKSSSTSRFYHGGHLGDLVCALYSIMKHGGGELYIGPHSHPCWNEKLRKAAAPLCAYQPYITKAEVVDETPEDLTYDFTLSWAHQLQTHDYVKGIGYHFEHSHNSIASCGLKKRDLINLFKEKHSLREILRMLNHDEAWLVAPETKDFDVVCHLPHTKLVRPADQWKELFKSMHHAGLKIALIGSQEVELWGDNHFWELVQPTDLLDAADYINSAKLFIGVSSCNNAIAEGLDQFRFVECEEAWGTEPQNERGWKINDWSAERVMNTVNLLCKT